MGKPRPPGRSSRPTWRRSWPPFEAQRTTFAHPLESLNSPRPQGCQAVAYDDLKEFGGRKYMGMPVGGQHSWIYPNGLWRERKVAPDKWEFTFASLKKREHAAPEGSGAPLDTQYHWYLLAHQRVRKIDEDTYETLMSGVKYKLAHKRPHWRKWSSEYPDQMSERERVMAILEETLVRLRDEASELAEVALAQT